MTLYHFKDPIKNFVIKLELRIELITSIRQLQDDQSTTTKTTGQQQQQQSQQPINLINKQVNNNKWIYFNLL